jgi:glyoxylase-like metal-dependent hydrolase (beta-lactamase superfamily II)
MKLHLLALLLVSLVASHANAQFPDPDGGNLERGTLAQKWTTGGPKCMEIPEWQVHEYNPNLYILRQSGCTDAEMPFLYLFFGKDRGLLWDTGSRNGNLAPAFQQVVHLWLERNHRDSIPVIVMHSHSHGDHTWGDGALQALHDPAIPVTFIPAKVADTQAFFHIASWPTDLGNVDLGDRPLDIIPIPGHDIVSIALYDRKTGILLTGDSLYPGRLYVRDLAEFQTSTERLIAFIKSGGHTKPVAHILGNHIEQSSTPFLDYPIGSIYHPQEHVLDLTYGTLLELEDALQSMNGKPRRYAARDFTIWPIDPKDKDLGAKMEEIEKRTNDEQVKNKWNQPK